MLGTLRMLRACRDRSVWPAAAIRALQERQLPALVAHAHAHVPFQRQRLEAARLAPAAIRSLDQLAADLTAVIPSDVRLEFEPWEATPPDPTQEHRPVVTKARAL